jgi:DNA-directed RNA polymerase specialized sigma24 family protein
VTLIAKDIDALYRSHARAMVTFFSRRTLDPEAAVDLVAETFAVAIACRSSCRAAGDDERGAWRHRAQPAARVVPARCDRAPRRAAELQLLSRAGGRAPRPRPPPRRSTPAHVSAATCGRTRVRNSKS